jgi:hypothetical protein
MSTTFDLAAAESAKAEGIQTALRGDEDWRARADQQINLFVEHGVEFSADDLVEAIGLPNDCDQNANNIVGSVFNTAARRKIIEGTGVRVKSRRVEGHARRIDVWRGYTGAAERQARLQRLHDEWLVVPEGAVKNRAQREPALFARLMSQAYNS